MDERILIFGRFNSQKIKELWFFCSWRWFSFFHEMIRSEQKKKKHTHTQSVRCTSCLLQYRKKKNKWKTFNTGVWPVAAFRGVEKWQHFFQKINFNYFCINGFLYQQQNQHTKTRTMFVVSHQFSNRFDIVVSYLEFVSDE